MPFDNPPGSPFGDLEILRTARSRIADEGSWLKGALQDGDRRCMVAALSVAAGSRNFGYPNRIERRLARILAAQLPSTAPLLARIRVYPASRRLMSFNDHARTRHEDVLAVYDRAIDHLTHKTTACAFV
jgi:hypothetical protein